MSSRNINMDDLRSGRFLRRRGSSYTTNVLTRGRQIELAGCMLSGSKARSALEPMFAPEFCRYRTPYRPTWFDFTNRVTEDALAGKIPRWPANYWQLLLAAPHSGQSGNRGHGNGRTYL